MHPYPNHPSPYPDHSEAQLRTAHGFLAMRAQVGADPAELQAAGADPEQVARQFEEDQETARRAARMLLARPADPASIRMMGLDEQDLDGWGTPPYPEPPGTDDDGHRPRHQREA
jgi:hypothetical protein